MTRENLTKFAWLAIFAAVVTIALKTTAYFLTGSIGLLSDALESLINLAAAIVALLLLKTAVAPPDDEHAYGHDKAEYFSGAIEGTLILIAAVAIGWAAVQKLFARSHSKIGVGLLVSAVATIINLVVGRILINKGREHQSVTLEADGKHLMTDVWTSVGIGSAIFAVSVTGWLILDPVIALVVAANITRTGFQLLNRSAQGLMDVAISNDDQKSVQDILDRYAARENIEYHALRTRQSGIRKFVAVHILVPGVWTVHHGHQLLDRIEADIRQTVPNTVIFTHLESLDDPASWRDIELDRADGFD